MYIKGRLIFFFVVLVIALCSVLILLIIKISVWKDEPFHLSDAKEIECLGSCEI
ncbi:TPA: nucleomodulin OrfX, partial [Listeria monocytogenes]